MIYDDMLIGGELFSQSFNCPNCSSPLNVEDSDATTLRCSYCNTSVIIPEEIRGIKPHAAAVSLSNRSLGAPPKLNLAERLESIREMAASGNKMGAVKAISATFVIGIKEADEIVEAVQRS